MRSQLRPARTVTGFLVLFSLALIGTGGLIAAALWLLGFRQAQLAVVPFIVITNGLCLIIGTSLYRAQLLHTRNQQAPDLDSDHGWNPGGVHAAHPGKGPLPDPFLFAQSVNNLPEEPDAVLSNPDECADPRRSVRDRPQLFGWLGRGR